MQWVAVLLRDAITICLLVTVAFIVRAAAPDAGWLGAPIYTWLILVSEAIVAFNIGRVLNHYVFRIVALLSTTRLLSKPMFYLLASDGVVADLAWVVFVWLAYDSPLVGMPKTAYLEQWFLLFFLMVLLACGRRIVLRRLMGDRLTQQYEALAERVIMAKSVIYRLTCAAHKLDPPAATDMPKLRKYLY